MGLSDAAIGTYRLQYRPLSAIRYLDVNPLPTRYTLFITLVIPFALVNVSVWAEMDSPRLSWNAQNYHKGFTTSGTNE
jgi:hypothetical protein